MKKVLLIGLSIISLSCSVKKNNSLIKTESSVLDRSEISATEKNIVNSFLEVELKKERYKTYSDFPISVIKESITKLYSLNIYENCYNGRDLPIKNSTNNAWILNEDQIQKIKETLNIEKSYNWNVSDFTSFNVSIIESSDLIKTIKENAYTDLQKKMILYLSKPLLIGKNNAFISFKLGDSSLGFNTINIFTALLKKNQEEKWEIDSYYYDPNSTW